MNRLPSTALTSKTVPSAAAGVLGSFPQATSGNGASTLTMPYKRITPQEARERCEKGLCYYCDDKFVKGHRCQRPQLFMIVEETSINETEAEYEENETEVQELMPEVSFHAITGTTHPQTMRLQGRLNNKEVTVLIDGGSTHNFMEQSIADKLGLIVDRTQSFQVVVANREKIDCPGRCLALTLHFQGYEVTTDFYILPVAACQVVLGVQWLETLGTVQTNYRKLTMSFQIQGVTYNLKGMDRPALAALKDKELPHLQGSVFFLQVLSNHAEVHQPTHPTNLQTILQHYSQVFSVPTELPPKRDHDHRIPLQQDSKPISVRPYRYPYYQKAEIEKLVKELLESGLIRTSNNPFSSPVLLVRKADGSWRFV